jgi:hypothetical protein
MKVIKDIIIVFVSSKRVQILISGSAAFFGSLGHPGPTQATWAVSWPERTPSVNSIKLIFLQSHRLGQSKL